jgi:hypothetical protein
VNDRNRSPFFSSFLGNEDDDSFAGRQLGPMT